MLESMSGPARPFAARIASVSAIALVASFLLPVAPVAAQVVGEEPVPIGSCVRDLTANVVALDQVFFWNRLGAVQPQGMIYALKGDVVPIDPARGFTPGNVELREGKPVVVVTTRDAIHEPILDLIVELDNWVLAPFALINIALMVFLIGFFFRMITRDFYRLPRRVRLVHDISVPSLPATGPVTGS